MEQEEIYQLLSFLLQYPDQEKLSLLEDIKAEVLTVQDDEIKANLLEFLTTIEQLELNQWIQEYVDQFDFGKKTNLYVTYVKLGEQRERGLELLKLKKYYEAAGYEITDQELPDYLPIILEFSGNVKKEIRTELLQMHEQAIFELHHKLAELKSTYLPLFDSLIRLLELDGVEHIAQDKQQVPTITLEDQEIMEKMRNQLIRNQLA